MKNGSNSLNMRLSSGPGIALLSAVLFGASTPFAKILLDQVGPWMLAGLLYLGSGLGLALYRYVKKAVSSSMAVEANLFGSQWKWLGLAILIGGVVGPVLLMAGLAKTSGAETSLLLNLEGVLTAALAWFVFKENFDRRIATGMIAIFAGAIVLTWPESFDIETLTGPILIICACLAWAIDNNLTRKVSLSDPAQIAMIKGCVAGTINVVIALMLGADWPQFHSIAFAGVVGFLGYGVSMVLFIIALRHLGTARTGAYFSLAPFFGAIIAVPLLGESPTYQLIFAGILMGIGVWLHLTENHIHRHRHNPQVHEHKHAHDTHHRHDHPGDVPPGELHSHPHVHEPLEHAHKHYPDAHHRHDH
ncbi:MAG: EamA family transporter [Rhodospirillaceae bacterium]|nr:EamA family transporter [Rhodospirillaceae bacterium]MBT5373721.1 EamA family transporter [Rhodospirillaceae bacterium]MBT5660097.1 EamA family transporter [Rhodospirillaceae bacterium]MBT5751940.1 EamA family transporter [Rhodospirillaceae bacterium]